MVNKIMFLLRMESLYVIYDNLKKYIEVCVRIKFDKSN